MKFTYIIIIALFLLLFWHKRRSNAAAICAMKIIRKRKGKAIDMSIAEKYIGKDCIITLMNSSTPVTGVIAEVCDGWISVEENDKTVAVNLDYVTSISNYPVGKNGKRKPFIA